MASSDLPMDPEATIMALHLQILVSSYRGRLTVHEHTPLNIRPGKDSGLKALSLQLHVILTLK